MNLKERNGRSITRRDKSKANVHVACSWWVFAIDITKKENRAWVNDWEDEQDC
jgi:hypothetical protein